MEEKQLANIKVSPRILEHLGISAYNSLKKCIGELAINAYDADATKVEIIIPERKTENYTIEIIDDGMGMSVDEIKDNYLFIGSNRRIKTGNTTARGRLVIGKKGIGKLAGFGISKTIEVVTVKDNVESTLELNRSAFDDFSSITDKELSIKIKTYSEPKTTGTIIKIKNITTIDITESLFEDLKKHLYKFLPKKPDFKIYINSVECTAEDVTGNKFSINEKIEGLGNVTGYYIIANSKQKHPGLVIRVRDRIVTEPDLFGLTARSHRLFTLDKIVGEIHADFLDPDSESQDLINTSRDGFILDSPKVQQLYTWANKFLDRILQGIEEEESKKRAENIFKYPDIKDKIDRMPPHIKSVASKVIKSVIDKLSNLEDDEVAKLVEWIVKYYESNILRELIDTIIKEDDKEIKKITELIQEWGVSQLNSVADIVKGQINIIIKLENLITNNQSLEIEMHKLIENNLWLIKEGLELWSSDKPLKTVLDQYIDENYKEYQGKRPDIIAKSINNGTEAIILEFKQPKIPIKMEHVTQALRYKSILEKHRPNIKFNTYVVGREFQYDVLASRSSLNNIFLKSYSEILQDARSRFEEILKILGR